jgi:uncharacterized protein (DUF2147 family)
MKERDTRVQRISTAVMAGLLLGFAATAAVAQQQPQPQPKSQPQQRAAPATAAGVWEQVDDNGKVGGWFYIYEREGVFEGRIVKTFPRPGEKPNPLCTKCQGEQKNQPTLGLTLIKGMQRKGRNYDNGTILDPRDGSVYSARMELSADGQKLMVRGFLGIDLFGQSQIWRRLPDTVLADITGSILPPEAPTVAKGAPRPQSGKTTVNR